MDKCKKAQILKLSLIAALLSFTPFLSSSLRPTYLYFIFNLVIILLGAESGLLTPSSKPCSSDDQRSNSISMAPNVANITYSFDDKVCSTTSKMDDHHKTADEAIEQSSSKVIVARIEKNEIKKSLSMPSLFFIGGGGFKVEASIEVDKEQDEMEEDWEICEISGQELFTRAENFIGNFYKQLKMQREESFKRLIME